MKKFYIQFVIFLIIVTVVGNTRADWSLDIEGGLAYNGYNNVRIPGNVGTKFSLSEELKAESSKFYRLRYTIGLGKKHDLSFLYSPLTIKSSGRIDKDINFNNTIFNRNTELRSVYRFDSYRVTYQYSLIDNKAYKGKIGFTGKIRDASIKIYDNSKYSEKSNTGFVPLIYFYFDWSFSNAVGLLLEGDALAAPQGRAEDILIAVYSQSVKNMRFRIGYRILEGGADNDEVYTFTLINYMSIGITFSFK